MAAQPTQPAAVAEPEGVPHPSLSTAQPVAPSVPVTAADALKAAAAQGVAAEGIPHLGGELDYPGGHPLHTAWLISYDKKGKAVAGVQQNNGFTRANGQNSASPSKDEALPRVLGRFNTVETFWQCVQLAPLSVRGFALGAGAHYVYLERPVDVIKDQTVHFFREMYPLRGEGYKGYQGAGCWLLKVHKNLAESGRMWERLLLATIG
ncbi:hypothetical protein T492DRAFT_886413 [Pavlovales sp. CCMP2436]|nr:hypothetical protein T492DRAFT_886413 [Pavlovales sp. CCMP2436]